MSTSTGPARPSRSPSKSSPASPTCPDSSSRSSRNSRSSRRTSSSSTSTSSRTPSAASPPPRTSPCSTSTTSSSMPASTPSSAPTPTSPSSSPNSRHPKNTYSIIHTYLYTRINQIMQKQQYQFNFDGFDPIFELNNPKNDPLFVGRETPNCAFCNHSYENEDQLKRLGPIYGPFKKKKDKQKYYVHHMCALWSDGIFISEDDRLQNIEKEIKRAQSEKCLLCHQYGASLKCHQMECSIIYHSRCFLLRYEQFLQEIPIFQPKFYFYCSYHKRLAEKDKNFLEEAQIEWVEQICYKCQVIDCDIICDKCDKTFHLGCAGLESDPEADIWFCEFCSGKTSNQILQSSAKKKKNERVIEDD